MLIKDEIHRKLIKETLIVDGIIFVLLCVFFFFSLMQIPLGFLLGSIISIINHVLLCFQGDAMVNPNYGSSASLIAVGSYFTRFLLYGFGIFIALFLDYIGYQIFAWYMVLIGYMIIKAIIMLRYGNYTKKNKVIDKSQIDGKE